MDPTETTDPQNKEEKEEQKQGRNVNTFRTAAVIFHHKCRAVFLWILLLLLATLTLLFGAQS